MSQHGQCECPSTIHGSGCNGPAAFEVVRDGKPLRVCTRCDLSSDKSKRALVTTQDSLTEYRQHDPLGAFCILTGAAGPLADEVEQ